LIHFYKRIECEAHIVSPAADALLEGGG